MTFLEFFRQRIPSESIAPSELHQACWDAGFKAGRESMKAEALANCEVSLLSNEPRYAKEFCDCASNIDELEP